MDGGRENRFTCWRRWNKSQGRQNDRRPCPNKKSALLQSAYCHGVLILEKHNVFEKGGRQMSILKIILVPLSLILSLFVWLCAGLLSCSASCSSWQAACSPCWLSP